MLGHERAHLRWRHHAMLTLTAGLARAFPGVPLLAQAKRQLDILAEMAADDAAVRGCHADDLAAALIILAGGRPRPAMLTADGPAAVARLKRLLTQPRAEPRPGRRPGRHRRPPASRGRRLRSGDHRRV